MSNDNLPMSVTTAEAKIRSALVKMQLGIQALKDRRMKLVMNEDNLPVIKAWLDDADKVLKETEKQRVELKKPSKIEGENVDKSAKIIISEVKPDYLSVHEVYSKICRDVDAKKLAKKQNDERIASIKEGINNNVMAFSTRIIECDSWDKLVSIERLMNLELTNEKKYGEYLPDLKARFEELRPQLKVLKDLYQQDSKQWAEMNKAIGEGEDGVIYDLSNKQEELHETIQAQKILISESASNSYSSSEVIAEEVLPEVKVKRHTLTWDLIDVKKFAKENPSMVTINVIESAVDGLMKQYAKEGKVTKDKEFVIDGIKYYYHKTY